MSNSVVFSKHALDRIAERGFPSNFMAVAEAAALAIKEELITALTKAACTASMVSQDFAVKSGSRRFNASVKNGLRIATEVVLGEHVAVIGMGQDCVLTIVTIKPNETRARRALRNRRELRCAA